MSASRKRILFVDDDVELLGLLQRLMATFAGETWEILTASDVSQAMVLIQQHRMDLLVVDIRMPLMDGVQFLELLQRRYPNLIKVVLTAEASEERRAACLKSGAELFLEKPREEGGWRAVYAMLNEVAKFQPNQGFSGVLRRVGLQDVLQMECLSRSSVVLEIRAGEQRGSIFVKDGQITHAEMGAHLGEDAFNRLLALAGGEFDRRPWSEPPQTTVTGSWEFLLMEAARARDEQEGLKAAAEIDTEFLQRDTATHPNGTVVPSIGASSQVGNVAGGTPTESPRTRGIVPGTTRSHVVELLICSLQGEVLHDWRCPNTTARVSFLEFISQKARQLAQRLPLGGFDRLEIEARSRVIVQIQPDRALFLRIKRVPLSAPREPEKHQP